MNSKPSLKLVPKSKLPSLKVWLDEIVQKVETEDYIKDDPISFMHAFDNKEDQILAGFFAAIMAWGRRDIVLAKVNDLLQRMSYTPFKFISEFNDTATASLHGFKHRTFTETDVYWLIRILNQAILKHGSFEQFWVDTYNIAKASDLHFMDVFHENFFALVPETPHRTKKHIADRRKNSSCKRLYLFLRWSIRKNSPVDLGIMDFMPESELMLPLDVHVARQARILGLISRHQNDWKTVEELTNNLKLFTPKDPSRYDYALFGIGVLKIQIPPEFIVNSPLIVD
ncbi:MAG TPA: TIGR02757 family protein [Bacteroidetes bacterium]|nr:TIGR02757 family protein [Bacteroidota bacterium]